MPHIAAGLPETAPCIHSISIKRQLLKRATLCLCSKATAVTKVELHERLWPGTYVSDATLAGLVKELRRALDDGDREHPVIRTAHRVGYAFCAVLEPAWSAPPHARWHWLVLRGRKVALHEGENVIGRDPTADVCLDAASVSRRHARIVIEGAGVRVDDLGSKNGTTVGDAAIANAVALHDGDRIVFGSVEAVYRSSTGGLSTDTAGRSAIR